MKEHDTPQYNSSATAKFSNIPEELKTSDCWVAKRGELPVTPYGSLKNAASTRPDEWGNFQQAVKTFNSIPSINGIGRMIDDEEDLVFIDLDDCIKDGVMSGDALDVVNLFKSYTEFSRNDGIHILIHGKIPAGEYYNNNQKIKFECYDSNKCITMTGDILDIVPQTIEHRQKELNVFMNRWMKKPELPKPTTDYVHSGDLPSVDDVVFEASSNPKFAKLYSGDFGGYPSQSEADQAFCNLLAFWCCGSAELMKEVFVSSGLMREKVIKNKKYLNKTILKALSLVSKRYEWCLYSDDKLNDLTPSIDIQLDRMGIKLDQLNTNHQELKSKVTEATPEPLAGAETAKEVAAKPKSQFVGFLASQSINRPLPQYLVKHHINKNTLSFIAADSGAGKTFYALEMGLSVATGKPFLDRYKVKQGKVVYLCGEGQDGINARITAWQQHHDLWTDNFLCIPSRFDFLNKESLARLMAEVRSVFNESPVLMIADTLSKMSSGDENQQKDMSNIQTNAMKFVNAWNCSFVFVHHFGKDSTRGMRGSSTLQCDADNVITLSRNSDGEKGFSTFVENTKMKEAVKAGSYLVDFKSIEIKDQTGKIRCDEDGEKITSLVCLQSETDVREMKIKERQKKELEADLPWLRLLDTNIGEGETTDTIYTSAKNSGLTNAQDLRPTRKKLSGLAHRGYVEKIAGELTTSGRSKDRWKRTKKGDAIVVLN